MYSEALTLICTALGQIGEISGREGVKNRRVYKEVRSQLESFKKWFESEGKHHDFIEKYIDKLLDTDLGNEEALEGTGEMLPWPDLSGEMAGELGQGDVPT